MGNLNNDVEVVNAESLELSVIPKMILTRFEELIRALKALVHANMDRKVTLTDAMVNIRELLECNRSIQHSDYFVMILKPTQEKQRVMGPVESKGFELQTMPGLVDESSRLWEELSKIKEDKD